MLKNKTPGKFFDRPRILPGANIGALLISLLFLQCTGSDNIDYADAIKLCTVRANNHSLVLPGTECIIGAALPTFQCTTIRNETIDENYFKNKISIVNFWFEGCAPCVAEIPGFNRLTERYGNDDLRYLAITLDDRQDLEAFLEEHPWNFDHVSNGKSIIQDVFHCPWGYPTTFLVDQKGVIRKVIIGGMADSTAVYHIQEQLIPSIDSLLENL
jgi:peroxiredoxin